MVRSFKYLVLLLGFALVSSLAQPVVGAQEHVDTSIDVVLVIDNSGSMLENDPSDMRISAAKLFTNLLAVGDQVGVVSMEDRTTTKALLSLSTIDTLTQFGWDRLKIIKTPDVLSDYTYAGESLDLAAQVMENAAKPNARRAVIFLTDGKPTYRDEDRAEQEQKYVGAVEKLKAEGIKVFSIALGANADNDWLLRALAVPTNGRVWPAQTADQLLAVYVEIMTLLQDGRYVDAYDVIGNVETFLANVNPRQQIRQINFVFPGRDNTAPTIEGLLLPDTPLSGVDKLSHFKDPNWAMFTARPEYVPRFNGEWRVSLASQFAQVPMIAVIKSDLRARVVEPISSIPDDEVAVRYYPAGRPLLIRAGARNKADRFEKRLAVWVKMQQPVMGDGFALIDTGSDHDHAPEDGLAAGLYDRPLAPGTYRMQVNISPTDSHVRLDKFYDLVVEPLPTMEVEVEPNGQLQVNEPVRLRVRFVLDGKPIDVDAAEIVAAVKHNNKVVDLVELKPEGAGAWEGEYLPPQSAEFTFGLTAHVDWTAPDRGPRHYTDYVELGYDVAKQPLVEVAIADADDKVGNLSDGVQRMIEFRSFSDQPVELQLAVEGVPQGSVFPPTVRINPNESGRRTVTVSSPAVLTSGPWQAQLRVTGSPGVRLSTTDLPLSFTVQSFLERNRWVLVLLGVLIFLVTWRKTRVGMQDFVVRNVELLRYGGR